MDGKWLKDSLMSMTGRVNSCFSEIVSERVAVLSSWSGEFQEATGNGRRMVERLPLSVSVSLLDLEITGVFGKRAGQLAISSRTVGLPKRIRKVYQN